MLKFPTISSSRRLLGLSGSLIVSSVRSFSSSSSDALASVLKDPTLIEWPDHPSPAEEDDFPVFDPASPTTILATVSTRDPKKAIEKCQQALPSWRDETTASHRAALLTKWSSLMTEHADDLATIMTLEAGKPLAESHGEVNYAKSFLDYFAAEAVRPAGAGGGFVVPSPFPAASNPGPKGHALAIHQAVGVAAMVAPWNFPLAMITRKVGPALAAGCTAVAKPSELTPLSAIALKNLADRAGFPEGVFELVTASTETTPAVGTEFCTNPIVKKISFTGSTRVGKILMAQSSSTVKRVSMELGGNACFVVFEDADVDEAVNAAMASKFRNAGQTCVTSDRFLIHSSLHDEFVSKMAEKVKAIKVGPGIDPETKMGPLINVSGVQVVSEKVQAAMDEGATLYVQTTLPEAASSPHFYPPTILTNVSTDSDIWKKETFGPVAAIRSFETEEEALEIANNVDVGLASYFFTKDLTRAFRFATDLEVGMVGVNEGLLSSTATPFGGVKESGIGTEGSPLGIKEYLETKYIFMKTSN